MLLKFKFHWPHLKLMLQGNKERKKIFESDFSAIFTSQDFLMAMKITFDQQTYQDWFGHHPTVILEGSAVQFHKRTGPDGGDDDNEEGELLESLTAEFFHFFSDEAKQSAATSYENFIKQMQSLQDRNLLNQNGTTIYDNTDGCNSQCRCATALCLLTVVANTCNCTIDRLVNAPAHGKQIVDAMNAVCKRHLTDCMRRVAKPNHHDSDLCLRFKSWLEGPKEENTLAQ